MKNLMENNDIKSDKKIRIIALIGNIILWVLLLPSMLFAFGSMFAADAGVTTKLHGIILITAIMSALFSPIIILAGAIASLITRKKGRFVLFLIFEITSLGFVALSVLLFILSAYVR
jgi:hypothetical protein